LIRLRSQVGFQSLLEKLRLLPVLKFQPSASLGGH